MRFRAHQTLNGWGSVVRKHKSKEGISGLSWLPPTPTSEGAYRPNLGKDERKKKKHPASSEGRKHEVLIVSNTLTVDRPLSGISELLIVLLHSLLYIDDQ